MTRIGISLVTCNEGHLVERCVAPFLGRVDEILVLDMGTDDCDDICRRLAKDWPVVHIPIDPVPIADFVRQRQLDLATTDWVLILDPDEIWHPTSIDAAHRAIAAHPEAAILKLPQVEASYGGRIVADGFMRGSTQTRLLRRGPVRWPIHGAHSAPEGGPTVNITTADFPPFVNHGSTSIAQTLEKIQRYHATGGDGVWQKAELRPLALSTLYLKHMFLEGGWRDGATGAAFNTMATVGDVAQHLQQWEDRGSPDVRAPWWWRPVGLAGERIYNATVKAKAWRARHRTQVPSQFPSDGGWPLFKRYE